MKVKVKKLVAEAVIPQYAKEGDAGLDLVAVSKKVDSHGDVVYGTGLAFEIPQGHVGLIFPRSSNAKKHMWLTNHVGVIDSGYRGEVMLKYRFDGTIKSLEAINGEDSLTMFRECSEYQIGERVGQLIIIPYPHIEFEEADELSSTERGDGGFGSSGK